jgi:hypothetical protein
VNYTVYTPAGVQYATFAPNWTGFAISNLASMPAGTYTVYVEPQYGATTPGLIAAVSGQAAVFVNGAGLVFQTTATGQDAFPLFTATASDNLELQLSSMTASAATTLSVNVYDFNNNLITTSSCAITQSTCNVVMTGLAAGAYRADISAVGGGTMNVTTVLVQQ